jgi:lysophospholipid acyltransferase (LPLAT)-like uncharacterized protein
MSMSPVREEYEDPTIHPRRTGGLRNLYIFWHETLVSMAGCYARYNIPVLISQHRDGELITQIIRCLGSGAIRGSSTRGGDRALRQMIEQSRLSHLAVTPDGPRGPRRKMQMGPVYLASRAGVRIVPLGLAAKGAWRANSWDRLAIPKPFMPIYVCCGTPITVPADLSRSELEQYRVLCERSLNETQQRAEAKAGEVQVVPAS